MVSQLNPWAEPFSPASRCHDHQSDIDAETQLRQEAIDSLMVALDDVPIEVLAIVASHLEGTDLVSCLLTCKRMLAAVAEAAVTIRVGDQARDLGSEGLHAVVDAIAKHYKGAVVLDVAGLPLEDHHLLRLLPALPKLRKLHLAGCRKITSGLADLLGCATGSSGSSSSTSSRTRKLSSSSTSSQHSLTAAAGSHAATAQLRHLNMQRCYQLNSQLLTALLAGAARPGATLQLLAMSHMDMSQFPFAAPTPAAGQAAPQPFAQLVAAALAASSAPAGVVTAAPASKLAAPLPEPSAHRFSSLRLLALHSCTRLGLVAMAALPLCCPLLEVLLLGGSTLPAGCSTAHLDMPERSTSLVRTLRTLLPKGSSAPAGPRGPVSIGSSSSTSGQLVREFAVCLAAMAAQLPRLKALELTLLPPGVVALVRALLRALPASGAGRKGTGSQAEPLVWDFCEVSSVYSALDFLAASQAATGHQQQQPASGGGSSSSTRLEAAAVALGLRCAANCSSGSRLTPLHCAAEQGDNAFAAGLLELGAAANARDSGGATALFLACEAGHAAVANTLLDAGADPVVRNAAGETPLYIAALRGHLQVVKSLVAHQHAAGIDWCEARLYGDCWTPLMAAAVANRLEVAKFLLVAAGPAAGAAISTANRYGQTVLHIAARKGSQGLLRLLLEVGAGRAMGERDASGDTPMDIAARNRHDVALAEFRRVSCVAVA